LAVREGYEIVRITELWHWKPENRTKDMFRDMIAKQYRQKVLSSGLPQTEDRVAAVLQELDELGVSASPDEFEINKARRALCKQSLNNIWISLFFYLAVIFLDIM